ncbi:MAG: S8 family serine peptidase [Gemmataceae bacterium]|nr:S8 family serine peptidase [Gemmataceae bacterium]
MAAAIGRARDAGHIIVAAAGNSAQNLDSSPQYPASYSTSYNNVITVASVNSSDQLASSSNYGANTVTLAAPGVSILSTVPNNGYAYYSGTSMAAPHVTGALALYWASHPTLSYTQVIDKLKTSVDPISDLAGKVQTGGRLNVGKMFDSAAQSGPRVVGSEWYGVEPFTLDRLRLTFDKAVDVRTFTSEDIVSFTGPGGAITTSYTISPVAGSGNKVFDVVFGRQAGAGTYTMVLGPGICDEGGNAMNQNGNGVNGEDPGDRYTASTVLGSSGPRVVEARFYGSAPRQFDRARLTFDKPINPDSFTVDDIAEFIGPRGAINTTFTITPVAGSGYLQYDVTFTRQTIAGLYKLTIGPDIQDSDGNKMNQNGNGINGESAGDAFTLEQQLDTTTTVRYDLWNINRAILDYRVIKSVINVTDAIVIDRISVRINIRHTGVGDMYIRLIGPNGQAVVLFNRSGGKGDNLTNTWFSDDADRHISQGRPPFTGTFRPVQPLARFRNILASGRWTLEIRDTRAGNVGKLLSWSLVVTGTMDDPEGGGLGEAMIDGSGALYLPPPQNEHPLISANRRSEDSELWSPIYVGS